MMAGIQPVIAKGAEVVEALNLDHDGLSRANSVA
jgi:hypothetical protein